MFSVPVNVIIWLLKWKSTGAALLGTSKRSRARGWVHRLSGKGSHEGVEQGIHDRNTEANPAYPDIEVFALSPGESACAHCGSRRWFAVCCYCWLPGCRPSWDTKKGPGFCTRGGDHFWRDRSQRPTMRFAAPARLARISRFARPMARCFTAGSCGRRGRLRQWAPRRPVKQCARPRAAATRWFCFTASVTIALGWSATRAFCCATATE
jgi:hypothetical protein